MMWVFSLLIAYFFIVRAHAKDLEFYSFRKFYLHWMTALNFLFLMISNVLRILFFIILPFLDVIIDYIFSTPDLYCTWIVTCWCEAQRWFFPYLPYYFLRACYFKPMLYFISIIYPIWIAYPYEYSKSAIF